MEQKVKRHSIRHRLMWMSAVMVFAMLVAGIMPIKAFADTEGTVLPGDILDRVTVSFHPAGQSSSLCIRDNGRGAGQNVVQLYNLGDSFRFWLTQTEDYDSYYIDFFGGADDYSPSNKRLDISDNDGYDHVGNVVHVVTGNKTAANKHWKFIRNSDGTYYVQNKRSDLYWGLQNDNYDDKNKLCQVPLERAQRWEMEIVRADGDKSINELKQYDSYSFKLNGETVTGANWMSFLSDDVLLSNVTIPGTHDAATVHTSFANANAQCQQLSIHDQLYNGIRYFDLRFGPFVNAEGDSWSEQYDELKLVHGPFDTCLYNGDTVLLKTVMKWVTTFLEENPNETVILQLKEDRGGKNVRTMAYRYFKQLAETRPDLVYIGDHVPKLGECRGKIVIFSRLDFADSQFAAEGGQWGLNVTPWVERRDHDTLYDPLGLAASGDNYEVWDQDEYHKVGDDKWKLICNSVFDSKTGAAAKRDAAKAKGKDAWVVSYTSCVRTYPQNSARTLNPKLVNKLLTDTAVLAGQFLGVICSDFTDQQLAYLVYKQNFIAEKSKVIIRGMTVDGKEPFPEMVIDVTPDAELGPVLESMENEIRTHFSSKDYVLYADILKKGLLTDVPMIELKNAEDYQNAVVDPAKYHGSDRPVFYVALGRVLTPSDGTGESGNAVTVEAPLCTTVVSGSNGDIWAEQTPKPKVRVTMPHVHVAKTDGIDSAYWYDGDRDGYPAYNGPMNDVENVHCHFDLEPDWGYCFNLDEKVWSGLEYTCNGVSEKIEPYVESMLLICSTHRISGRHTLAHVNSVIPGCTSEGLMEHDYCVECGKCYDADHKVIENVKIPSLGGHNWGDWNEIPEEGIRKRSCQTCGQAEIQVITESGHVHDLQEVSERAATCEEEGSKGYWICSKGDRPCGRYFSDAEGAQEISRDSAVIPALGHLWIEPVYEWAEDHESVTARHICLHDDSHSHLLTETAAVESQETVPATCEQEGTIEHRAVFQESRFEPQSYSETVLALGHDWDEGTLTKETSCTEEGELTYTCKRDKSHFITEKIDASGHDWGPAIYTWAEDKSTVTAMRVCANDAAHIESETVDVIHSEVEPSCTTAGEEIWYTKGFQNEDFVIQEIKQEVKPLGHDWGPWVTTKAATETENGEETRTCIREESHQQHRVIPAGNHVHTLRHIAEKAATCKKAGNIEYWVCEGAENCCYKVFSDASGTTEIDPEQTVTAAIGHEWGAWTDEIPATCSSAGVQFRVCKHDSSHQEYQVTEIDPDAHEWDEGKVTKEPCYGTEGSKLYTCTICGKTKTETIPAKEKKAETPEVKPGCDPKQMGEDGTAVGKGASAAAAEKAILGMKSDRDPAGTKYAPLKAKSVKQTKKAVKLTWTKVKGASKYVIYGNACGKSNKMKTLAICTGSSAKLSKVADGKTKKGTYYKFILVALDKNNDVVSTSKVIHIATKGGKVTNPKKVTVKKGKKAISKVAVKKGKTMTVKCSVTKASKKLKIKTHRKVKFESGNNKIATVTSKGKIKGIKRGTCYIYAYAQNGVAKKIKVTVN